jgi:small subunit ribosomal protein S15
MSIDKVKEIQISVNDCGSTAVQIYYLTEHINKINDHLKLNPKDNAAKRGVMVLIGKRNRLCKYYKKRYSMEKYVEIIKEKIGLRK